MLKKKLLALSTAVILVLSSLTTSVIAADIKKPAANAKVMVKFAPGKENANKNQIKKNDEKKNKFIDSKDVIWAFNAIEKLAYKGILGGIGQGKFAPQNKVTHLEALAMVLRLTGDDNEAESRKDQVHHLYKGPKTNWGLGYIFVAIDKKIILPEELGSFNPSTPAKRHEIAKYIIRAMGKTDEALEHMNEELPFKDSSAVPKKSVGYVYLVNELEIMVGYDNLFKPMEPVTRAQMAVLLDNAEGNFNLPDTDNRKNNIVFVSANADYNKITVNAKGITVTYNILEGTQIYKNDSFLSISDLVKGDILQLTLNGDKKVIFIEVVKGTEDDSSKETKVSFSKITYSNLPKVLRDEVDSLKQTENYKAYEYGGYLYLVAAMGKKNTGGYSIDIKNVYKTLNGGKYSIKAVVDTNEPSSSSNVTMAITYPYCVVRFKDFNNIKNIIFVDQDDYELANVKIIDINESTLIEGEIYDIITSSKTIRVKKPDGTKVSYIIPTDAEITVNDYDAEFSDLEEGMSANIEIKDNKVIRVTAEDFNNMALSFEYIDYSDLEGRLKDQVDYLKLNKNYKAYRYYNYIYLIASMGKKNTECYVISIEDVLRVNSGEKYIIKAVTETTTPSEAKNSLSYYPYSIVRFKSFDGIDAVRFIDGDNNKLAEVKIAELDEAETVKGTIRSINTKNKTIKVEKSNGSVVILSIPNDAAISVNDNENASFSDFKVGMKAEIKIIEERAVNITAEDSITTLEGILTGLSISSEKKITLKAGNNIKTYIVDSNVKIIIDDEYARVEDLRINDELAVKFSNGILFEIEKK